MDSRVRGNDGGSGTGVTGGGAGSLGLFERRLGQE